MGPPGPGWMQDQHAGGGLMQDGRRGLWFITTGERGRGCPACFLVYTNGRGGAGGALRGLWFLTTRGRGPGCPAWSLVYNNGRGVAGGARLLLQLSVPFSLRPAVLPGPGAALGTGHHGTRAAGERAGHLPPGSPALPPSLLPRQERRCLARSAPSPGGDPGWELVPAPPRRGRAPGVAPSGCFLAAPRGYQSSLKLGGLNGLKKPSLPVSPHLRGSGSLGRGQPTSKGLPAQQPQNTCVSAYGPAGSRLLKCLGNDALTPAHCVRLWFSSDRVLLGVLAGPPAAGSRACAGAGAGPGSGVHLPSQASAVPTQHRLW